MFSFFLLLLEGISSNKIVVFDCGSTGTRAMIIQYTDPNDLYDFRQSSENSYFYSKGRTKKLLEDKEGNMGLIMELFDSLNTQIPESERNQIPLLFLHTAGLRAMSVDKQKAINDLMYDYIKNNESSKYYIINRENFRVISGDEEALYQWITVNQIYGYFDSVDTMPILSLGGESMQFAIELRNAPEDDFMKSFVYTIRINDKYHYVFLYSWLKYGTTDLADLSHQKPYAENKTATTPCMFEGGNYSIYLSTVKENEGWVDIPGKGDFNECKARMNPYITETTNKDKCEDYMPTVSDYNKDNCVPFADKFNKLYALSCVGDAFRFIPEIKKLKQPTYKQFIEQIRQFAKENITYVLGKNDEDENSLWSISNAAMVSSFMEKAFKPHLGEEFENLILYYEDKHNGNLLAWNLGAAIAHDSTDFVILEPTPYEESWWTAGRIAGVTIGIVAAVAIIIGVIIFVIIKKRNKNDSISVGEQA